MIAPVVFLTYFVGLCAVWLVIYKPWRLFERGWNVGHWVLLVGACLLATGVAIGSRKLWGRLRILRSALLQFKHPEAAGIIADIADPKDPRVAAFYRRTRGAWIARELESFSENHQKEAAVSDPQFAALYRPVVGGVLHLFLTRFPPREGEFLIGLGEGASGPWFLLTNQRLLARDGRKKELEEIELAEIDTFTMSGRWWTMTLSFQMQSGERTELRKMGIAPRKEVLAEAIGRCRSVGPKQVPETGSGSTGSSQ